VLRECVAADSSANCSPEVSGEANIRKLLSPVEEVLKGLLCSAILLP